MVYGTIIYEVGTWEPSSTPPSSLSPHPSGAPHSRGRRAGGGISYQAGALAQLCLINTNPVLLCLGRAAGDVFFSLTQECLDYCAKNQSPGESCRCSFLNVFTAPVPKAPACSRPGTSHRDPRTGLPADQSPIPLTSQPEGYFQDQSLTGHSHSKSLARKKPVPINEEKTKGPLEKWAK